MSILTRRVRRNRYWKFLWVGGATLFAIFVGATQIWDWFAKHFKVTGIK